MINNIFQFSLFFAESEYTRGTSKNPVSTNFEHISIISFGAHNLYELFAKLHTKSGLLLVASKLDIF